MSTHALGAGFRRLAAAGSLPAREHALEPQLVSLPEGARALGLGLTAFRKLLDRGEITSAYVGRRRLIPAPEIRRYAARLATDAPTAPAFASDDAERA